MIPAPDASGAMPTLDLPRLVQTLDRHGVEYVMVGGAAAIGYGVRRATEDLDCVPRRDTANLQRLADAMRELGARVRAEGLSDEEAKQLPVILDARTIGGPEISTWMTDAGALDVLANIPDRTGGRLAYDRLAEAAEILDAGDVQIRVAGLDHIIASKEWANRPKDHEALGELRALRDARAAVEAAKTCFPTPARGGAPVTPDRGRPRGPDATPDRDRDR